MNTDTLFRHKIIESLSVFLSLVLLACFCVTSGCVGSSGQTCQPPPNVPLPNFRSASIITIGQSYLLHVDGFEEYVKAYGRAGWLRGLDDSRPLAESCPDWAGAGIDMSGFRVKDAFYFYYVESLKDGDLEPLSQKNSIRDRDKVIAIAKQRIDLEK